MEIVLSFWNVLAMMAPWLLVGFLLAGVASVLLPRKWVVGVMGRARGWRGVLNAVLTRCTWADPESAEGLGGLAQNKMAFACVYT